MDIPLTSLATVTEADFDPRGVAGQPVDPRIQALRVNMTAEGIDDEQAAIMTEQFMQRCPIYTTLSRAAPIEITVTKS